MVCFCFNPRSHVGSDHLYTMCVRCLLSFNPRSHVGSDSYFFKILSTLLLFQSTLPRRERHEDTSRTDRLASVSIHAPTEGATDPHHRCQKDCVVSIHASTWGATNYRTEKKPVKMFQSTLPRGERRVIPTPCTVISDVSIHAPTRGATISDSLSL